MRAQSSLQKLGICEYFILEKLQTLSLNLQRMVLKLAILLDFYDLFQLYYAVWHYLSPSPIAQLPGVWSLWYVCQEQVKVGKK